MIDKFVLIVSVLFEPLRRVKRLLFWCGVFIVPCRMKEMGLLSAIVLLVIYYSVLLWLGFTLRLPGVLRVGPVERQDWVLYRAVLSSNRMFWSGVLGRVGTLALWLIVTVLMILNMFETIWCPINAGLMVKISAYNSLLLVGALGLNFLRSLLIGVIASRERVRFVQKVKALAIE